MIQQDVGFLLYLTWADDFGIKEEDEETDKRIEYEAETLMDLEDEEVSIQDNEERELIEKFNTALFRAETITKVEDETSLADNVDDELDALQCLPSFPTYCFNEREYLLLSDIQYLYEMREDFCLAVLARWGNLDKGFVDSSTSALALLNTKGDDFIDKEHAAIVCTSAFADYEKEGLPSEEEFRLIQERLGVSEMGIDVSSNINESSRIDESKISIDLFTDAIYDLDEDPQVRVLNRC